MPLERNLPPARAAAVTSDARTRLEEIAALYHRVEAHVGAREWREVGEALARVGELLPTLGGVAAARRAATDADACELDALVAAVVDAHARTLEHAESARAATATALAGAHRDRARAARYRPSARREAFFTSRTV